MVRRSTLPLSFCVVLAACGSTNPFMDVVVPDTDDPSTTNSKFAFDSAAGLTMNDVTYDAANDELIISNLPFDGPEGRYEMFRTQNGVPVYASRMTGTTGQIQNYAVYIKTADLEAAAAADAEWDSDGFGFGGANVKRTAYSLPGSVGEYVYLGTYAGVRQKNDRGGLSIVNGDARLLLDVLDLEPEDGVVGSIRGTVTNRTRQSAGGTVEDQLPTIYLARVSLDASTGTFTEGGASTRDPDGQVRDTGTYEGVIAGTGGEGLGAHVVMTGPSEMQRVSYEIIDWVYEEQIVTTDPVTGVQTTTTQTTSGSVSGLNDDNRDAITGRVDDGETIGYLAADRSGIPVGAQFTSVTETEVITGDGEAREIGVIVSTKQPDR